MSDYNQKWHREIEIFGKIKPMLILEGNVLDKYQYPVDGSISKGSIIGLSEYLHYYYKDLGYKTIVFYDNIHGFYNSYEKEFLNDFVSINNIERRGNSDNYWVEFKGKNNSAPMMIQAAMMQKEKPTVVIMDYASRYIKNTVNMDQSEIDSFTILMQATVTAKEIRENNGEFLKNQMVLIVNKINDLPTWFYLDNPNAKTILLSTPSKDERKGLVNGIHFKGFFARDVYSEDSEYFVDKPEELEKIKDRFVALTEGFSFTELTSLRRLCKNQKIRIKNLCDVIDLYKFGIKENPWKSLDLDQMKNAYDDFEVRVKGQSYALTKTLDVIKRAITGMANVTAATHGKPKGVLFFAGPTGTGKTETAKTLAEILFGDESACIRFDMSEYSQSHSDQKLLGAPPGYVGYESGGQLTNAVKNNPFSILLFDEIEKAHPSILDKFLQILEDGRMTDGKGETVYFSESIIIFTSNLGIYKTNNYGEREQVVDSNMNYDEVQKAVQKGIEDYFKLQLGRPEILNRIGENIIVFDFIRPDVAENILKARINSIINNMRTEMDIVLSIDDEAMETLKKEALKDLDNGGRGIGNIVESMLVNPLSRYMFDQGIFGDKKIIITQIKTEDMVTSLKCDVSDL